MVEFVDFFADWCGPCKIMDSVFEEVEKEYGGRVKFTKVDVEAEGEKAEGFGISSIPTFVILKEGKEVDRRLGAMPKDALKSWLDYYLD